MKERYFKIEDTKMGYKIFIMTLDGETPNRWFDMFPCYVITELTHEDYLEWVR